MSEGDDGDDGGLTGLEIGAAVERVLARTDGTDEGAVRAALERVAEDGVVSREGVDEAVADASMVVSSAENRTEMASIAVSGARETARERGVADVDAVRARLDAFASRLSALEGESEELQAALGRVVERADDPESVYEVARGIRRVENAAPELRQRADQLQADVEAFEEWLGNSAVRFDELEGDVDAIEESLDELADAVEELADAVEGAVDGAGADESAEGVGENDLAEAWFETVVSHRVKQLVLTDTRAELADLRAWDDREGGDGRDRADALEGRLDDLDARWERVGSRLYDLARPGWGGRFDEELRAVESTLEGHDPPVDWGAVTAELEEYRSA